MGDADAALVHGALAGLGRALTQVAADPRKSDQNAAVLERALGPLRDAVDKFGTVTVAIEPDVVRVSGPRGELHERVSRELTVEQSDGELLVKRPTDRGEHRALTFRRGVILPELQAFAAAAVPAALESDSDAVGELWKADLGAIQYAVALEDALAGHSAAAAFASEVQQLASKARDAVEYVDADASLLDRTQPPPL